MIKKVSLCLLFVLLLFISCKKDTVIDQPKQTFNVVGTWALSSYQLQYAQSFSATVAQYPCLADNILTLNADGTSSGNYTGTANCYITPVNADPAAEIGIVGQAPVNGTWSLNGNKLHLSSDNIGEGTVTSVNGKLLLTFNDSTAYNSIKFVATTVDVKQ